MIEQKQKNKVIKYWLNGAKKSINLANDVLAGKYYDHALFCGHLALEKFFKAKAVETTNNHAPHSHDLLYLAGLAKIDLDIEQQQFLAEVNSFSIEGRYPEEKLAFHKKVTKNFAVEWLKKINRFYLWLLKQKGKN